MKISIFLGSFFMLLLGGMIYILFRSNDLIMFTWFNKINLSELFSKWRLYFVPLKNHLPNWFLFSLPDGLWVLSYGLSMNKIWKNDSQIQIWFWSMILPFIAIISELGQIFKLVPGTFDWVDLLFYFIAIFLITKINKSNNYEKVS
ncbi:MAG: hypothetical protein K9G36_01940 [Crocinitomicaceae bacterium]|nr:hypothetical protein [Crocinitomicaceae bacterium]MCF8444443.1 hypothetical protein [Crocinitomicaceae bacterium]